MRIVRRYATQAETFALNNALVAGSAAAAAALAAALDSGEGCAPAPQDVQIWTRIGAVVCGTALANQHTSVLVSAPLAMWVCWGAGRERTADVDGKGAMRRPPRRVAELSLSARVRGGCDVASRILPWFLAPILIFYGSLVLASLRNTPGSWGDLTSVAGFWRHVSRAEYGSLRLAARADGGDVSAYFGRLAAMLTHEGLLCGSALATLVAVAAALAAMVRARTSYAAAALGTLLFSYVLFAGVFVWLANIDPSSGGLAVGVLERFWMQPDVTVAIFVGTGVASIAGGRNVGDSLVQGQRPSSALSALAIPRVVLAAALVGGAAHAALSARLTARFPDASVSGADRDSSGVVDAWSHAVLAALPPHSLVLSYTDMNWNGLRYLQVSCVARLLASARRCASAWRPHTWRRRLVSTRAPTSRTSRCN